MGLKQLVEEFWRARNEKGCDTGVKQVCIWGVFVGRAHAHNRWVVAREHVYSMCKELAKYYRLLIL